MPVYSRPEMPADARWLCKISLHTFTAVIPRSIAIGVQDWLDGRICGCMPALGFSGWCERQPGHTGDHSAVKTTAVAMDRRDATITR